MNGEIEIIIDSDYIWWTSLKAFITNSLIFSGFLIELKNKINPIWGGWCEWKFNIYHFHIEILLKSFKVFFSVVASIFSHSHEFMIFKSLEYLFLGEEIITSHSYLVYMKNSCVTMMRMWTTSNREKQRETHRNGLETTWKWNFIFIAWGKTEKQK